MYSCNLCKDAGERFMVPADLVGVELMKAHLTEKHGITDFPTSNSRGLGDQFLSEHPGQRGWWQ